MFGPGRGAWDETWTRWWGPDPPYHAPVFVLTHHERAPLAMQGGTTFRFVTDGIDSALDGLSGLVLEPTEVIDSPTVTHLRYRVRR